MAKCRYLHRCSNETRVLPFAVLLQRGAKSFPTHSSAMVAIPLRSLPDMMARHSRQGDAGT